MNHKVRAVSLSKLDISVLQSRSDRYILSYIVYQVFIALTQESYRNLSTPMVWPLVLRIWQILTCDMELYGIIWDYIYIYGWWLTYEYPSEKYEFVNGKDSPILNKENKTCLKPPTRKPYVYVSENWGYHKRRNAYAIPSENHDRNPMNLLMSSRETSTNCSTEICLTTMGAFLVSVSYICNCWSKSSILYIYCI